jgi:hypothetical protein
MQGGELATLVCDLLMFMNRFLSMMPVFSAMVFLSMMPAFSAMVLKALSKEMVTVLMAAMMFMSGVRIDMKIIDCGVFTKKCSKSVGGSVASDRSVTNASTSHMQPASWQYRPWKLRHVIGIGRDVTYRKKRQKCPTPDKAFKCNSPPVRATVALRYIDWAVKQVGKAVEMKPMKRKSAKSARRAKRAKAQSIVSKNFNQSWNKTNKVVNAGVKKPRNTGMFSVASKCKRDAFEPETTYCKPLTTAVYYPNPRHPLAYAKTSSARLARPNTRGLWVQVQFMLLAIRMRLSTLTSHGNGSWRWQ